MDNRPFEQEAETFVIHKLLKYDFKTSKPTFDIEGTDLLIVNSLSEQFTSFLKIQCKGRTVTNNKPSILTVPERYVKENYILFLYVKDEHKIERLFTFFCADILQWKRNKDKFILTINRNLINSKEFQCKVFNEITVWNIRQLLSKTEIKKFTSLIIDGIFLEKALGETLRAYKDIYPQKTFRKPNLKDIIENILIRYNGYHSENRNIQCYVFVSIDFQLHKMIIFDTKSNSFIIKRNHQEVKIFTIKSGNILAFEIQEQIDRLINSENVILVADDIIYEAPLMKLKNKGADIILVKLREEQGGNLFVNFRWGDIIYPLGSSIGLESHEL